jgi:hypothetical protein
MTIALDPKFVKSFGERPVREETIGTLHRGKRLVSKDDVLVTITNLEIFCGGCSVSLKPDGKRPYKVTFPGDTTVPGKELPGYTPVDEMTPDEVELIKWCIEHTWARIGDDVTSAVGRPDNDWVPMSVQAECTLDRFSVDDCASYYRDHVQTNENYLTLSDDAEAEIATEYGDGTIWKKGDRVLHNHVTGKYRKTPEDRIKEVWEKFRTLGYHGMLNFAAGAMGG